MRLRNTATGHGSPPPRNNVDVSPPGQTSVDEPRRKRIKLKFSASSSSSSAEAKPPIFAVARPKRQSAGRARYMDGTSEDQPRTIKLNISNRAKMSSSSSLLSSPPVSQPSSEKSAVPDYGADFLANFIEEPTPTPANAPLPRSKSSLKRALSSNMGSSTPPQHVNPIPSDSPISAEAAIVTKLPQKVDSPGTVIKKLQIACHALDSLNISAGPVSMGLSPLPHGQESEVDNLLLAAAKSSPASEQHVSSVFVGTVDEDMAMLIRNAMQIFRSVIVTKNQQAILLGLRSPRVGGKVRGKRGDNSAYSAQNERFAMSALEDLLNGSALNVNCIVSRERSALTLQLYKQLQGLMNMPDHGIQRDHHFMPAMQPPMVPSMVPGAHPPMIPPAILNGATPLSPHQFMYHPEIAAQHQQMPAAVSPYAPPDAFQAPHQFLFREREEGQEKKSKHAPDNKGSAKPVMSKYPAERHSKNALPPRSGPKMKLKFSNSSAGRVAPGMPQPMGPPSRPVSAGPIAVGE